MTRSLRWVVATLVAAFMLMLISVGARAEPIYGLTTSNSLVTFDSTTPGSVTAPLPITGLLAGEDVVAIDFRPSTPGVLVGLTLRSGSGRIVVIDLVTGVATQINSGLVLTGSEFDFGIDFNPVANALRIVDNADQNLRVTAGGAGTINVDAALNPSGQSIDSIAYSNNFAGATTTTLYGIAIAPEPDLLVTIAPPNSGVVNTVGPVLPLDPAFLGDNGFDISGFSAIAYAMFRPSIGAPNTLFTINLATGASTSLGAIGVAPGTLRDISVFNGVVPEPGTLLLLALGGALGVFRTRRAA